MRLSFEPRGLRVGGDAAIKDILRTSSRTLELWLIAFKFRVHRGFRALLRIGCFPNCSARSLGCRAQGWVSIGRCRALGETQPKPNGLCLCVAYIATNPTQPQKP